MPGFRGADQGAAYRARRKQYNSREHKQQRRNGQAQVDAGVAHCWRCGMWLPPGSTWHVGHDDYDRSVYRGTECVPCNLKAAARKGARVANGRSRRRQHDDRASSLAW